MKRYQSRHTQGYTLIEMMIVMGLVMLMITLVLLSVSSMLRSSRMMRASSLFVAAADEARTTAVTLRRSTKIDLTQLDQDGQLNRLTVTAPYLNENFEQYNLSATSGNPIGPANTGGGSYCSWVSSAPSTMLCVTDGSRCMQITGSNTYFNIGTGIDSIKQAADYETVLQARVKFLPSTTRTKKIVTVMGCIQSAGASVTASYGLQLQIQAAASPAGRNTTSTVTLTKNNGPMGGPNSIQTIDVSGAPSTTTSLVEGVWYRVSLSIKLYSNGTAGPNALVAGKVWADGQLEPWQWTVIAAPDAAPLLSGFGGFQIGPDATAQAEIDDVLFDMRPIRVIPAGVIVQCMKPGPGVTELPPPVGIAATYKSQMETAGNWLIAPSNPPDSYYFPVLFRPDGTTAQTYVIRLTDFTSGDKRYVVIDRNTGRARLVQSLNEAIKQ